VKKVLEMNNSHFLKKAVIITGASAGIGRELALMLAEQGAWLALAKSEEDMRLAS
jgi:NAD(P)-dependent dehydrogenase (short-subunit alcohol dehydrogenase family)